MKNITRYILGIALGAFGLLTLYLSGSIIFDLFGMRAKQGDYVMLVIWVNFTASLLYLFASYGFFKQKKQTTLVLGTALVVLILGYIGLQIHINSGGIYENKTPKALLFRFSVTLIFVLFSYFLITKKTK